MTYATHTPDSEVAAILVPALAADETVAALLFPTWAPSLGPLDTRIYSAQAELPDDPGIREALPRIQLELTWTPVPWEQEDPAGIDADVTLYLHVLTPRAYQEHASKLMAAAYRVVTSTPLVGASIIGSAMAPVSSAANLGRETAFNDAWHYQAIFRSPSVGV